MNLFRSEEHVKSWLAARGAEPGATLSAATMCAVAHDWYRDRLADDWRPRGRDESQSILARYGLRGEFWQLA